MYPQYQGDGIRKINIQLREIKVASAERLLISGILTHKDMNPLFKSNFTSDLMIRYNSEMLFIEKYGRVPSIPVFLSKFPKFKVKVGVTKEDISHLIDECRDNTIRFNLSKQIKWAALNLRTNKVKPNELVTKLEDGIRKINMKFGTAKDVDILSNYKEYLNEYKVKQSKFETGESIGIPYNYPSMNKYLRGMMPGSMITIVARTGQFKTWFLEDCATSAIINNKKVLFISLEMTRNEIASRLFTLLSYRIALSLRNKRRGKLLLPNDQLMLGEISHIKVSKMLEYISSKYQSSFIVPDIKGRMSIADVVYKVEQHKPDIVFFDYFGLSVAGSGKVENWMEAQSASVKCKEIARTYNIPFVIAAQLNRAGADKLPQLQHIALTDSLGSDSDAVIALQRKSSKSLLSVILKNRHGLTNVKTYYDIDINNGIIKESYSTEDTAEE